MIIEVLFSFGFVFLGFVFGYLMKVNDNLGYKILIVFDISFKV